MPPLPLELVNPEEELMAAERLSMRKIKEVLRVTVQRVGSRRGMGVPAL